MRIGNTPGLIAGLLLGVAAGPGSAAPVRSAAEPDYPPLSIVNERGEADGFSVELLRSVLGEMGREVTFAVGPWSGIKQDLAEGRLDVLPLVGRTPEREALYDFSIPYLTLHGALFVRDDNTNIRSWTDVHDQRVAVMRGDNAEEYARRTRLTDQLITTDSFEQAFRMLSDGHVDAVVAQRLMGVTLLGNLGITDIKVVGPPSEEFVQTFSFAVPKGQTQLLAVLNEGLARVIARGGHRDIERKWLAGGEQAAELARVIFYGGDHAFPPYEFIDEQGQPAGFNIDLARAVARELGVDITFQLGPWHEIRDLLEAGQLDMGSMLYSEARSKLMDFTVPHTRVYQAVFARNDHPPYYQLSDLTGRRIAVQRGDIMHDEALRIGFGDALVVAENPEDALALLAGGRVDFTLAGHLQGLYWIKRNGWEHVAAVDARLLGTDYCFVVQQGRTTLLELLNDGLRQVNESGEYREIRNRWLGVLEPEFSWRQHARTIALLLAGAALLAALAAGNIFVLRRQVRHRTAELETSRAELLCLLDDERRSAAERKRLVTAIEQSRDTIVITETDGAIIYVNPAFERISGYSREEVIGQNPRILKSGRQDPEFYREMWAVLTAGREWSGQMTNRRKDGTLYLEMMTITPVRDEAGRVVNFVAVKRDITHEIELEEQLRQSQKMDAIGRLAGGVAHDFNNMLAVILGTAEMALEQLDPSSPLHADLEEIRKAATRSADLTRQLLAFARKQTIVPRELNLNEHVLNLMNMLQRLIGENIEVVWEPAPDLWTVRFDPHQLDQILTNLCVNARDAIDGVGRIILATANHVVTGTGTVDAAALPPGDYVRLTVQDNGRGMGPATLSHLFEPFFTTKGVGEGTGLGLSTVYGIVKQNDGEITVESAPGQGTTFSIDLPRHHSAPAAVPESAPAARAQRGQETILLVEDEPAILSMVNRILTRQGYTVLAAATPDDAIHCAREHAGSIDLLITDVVMPRMNGLDLAHAVRELCPELKCLFISGYAENVLAGDPGRRVPGLFIQKPFSREALAAKVRQALDGP